MKVTVLAFLIVLSETTEEYRCMNNAFRDKVIIASDAVEPKCNLLFQELIDR